MTMPKHESFEEMGTRLDARQDRLPAQERYVLLRRRDGVTYRAIATELGVSDQKVKTLMARGQRLLNIPDGLLDEKAVHLGHHAICRRKELRALTQAYVDAINEAMR